MKVSDGLELDKEILDIIVALNASGIITTSSCSGHGETYGHIMLQDGRLLVVVPKERTKHEICNILGAK